MAGKESCFENQLNNIEMKTESHVKIKSPSKNDKMIRMLCQGLETDDKSFLKSVWNNKNESAIKSIVSQVPAKYINSLISQLSHLLHGTISQ